MTKKKATTSAADPKQEALARIEGLGISDVLKFFYDRATPRDKKIAKLVDVNDELEVDGAILSEGDDNGSFVLAWSWVSFAGTALDKDKEDEDVEDAD
jgi:hypothetical protein